MKIKGLYIAIFLGVAGLLSSCRSPKEVVYFTDLQVGQSQELAAIKPVKLQPNDKITIIVSTSDARLNALFNLAYSQNTIHAGGASGANTSGAISSGSGNNVAPYTVDSQGDINFPVLGKLHVAGMTREEVAEYVRRELISRDLAKNPIVTVEYLNLAVSVLGDVGSPGRQFINSDNYTILDAIAAAGDINITGKRDQVKVLREEGGMQKMYEIDLNSGKDITRSPVYYLRQNDVIYVEPNSTKARTSTPNANAALTPSFWISLVSFALTLGVLFKK